MTATVVSFTGAKNKRIRASILRALAGGQWVSHLELAMRVTTECPFANQIQFLSVLDDLWDAGILDQDGEGAVDGGDAIEWRLLGTF